MRRAAPRRLLALALAAAPAASLAAGCPAPAPPRPSRPTPPPPRPADQVALAHLFGTWRWQLETDQPGVHRIERERWHFAPDPAAPRGTVRALGTYDRDVEIRSTDGVPFTCAQDTVYHQRARFQVRAETDAGAVRVTELGYRAEPGPCDHGFRRIGSYLAAPIGDTVRLTWDGGDQTLRRDGTAPLPAAPPWPGAHPRWDGPWTWSVHTMDDGGDLRDEREDWRIAVRGDGLASATYVRTVTTTSIDGRPFPCSGTRRWSYVDRYVLDGHVERGLLTLTEVSVDAGSHPCLAATPRRSLGGATAQLDGDHVELEWRGKRRQVLHRPGPAPRPAQP
jgi:hypothetical protein